MNIESCILKKYQTQKYSLGALGKEYKISTHNIKKILSNNGIKILPCYISRRKNHFDQNYFNIIDSEEKAYFLGLLYADGCVSAGNRITIRLQATDKHILENFKKSIKSTAKLYLTKAKKITHQDQYAIILSSETMYNDLIKLGCIPKKSLILKFPTEDQVPRYLIRHFIRGYFDGDGHIAFYKRKNKEFYLLKSELIATEDFCNELSKITLSTLGIKPSKLRKRKETTTRYWLLGGTQQAIKFLTWIYYNSSIYINRKYKTYTQAEQKLLKRNQLKEKWLNTKQEIISKIGG